MATGPCGVEFRNAFSCFHYSDAEPKGSDCYDLFKTMQVCMQKYPTLYNKDMSDDDDLSNAIQQADSSEVNEDSVKVATATEKDTKKS
nr:unnamed protein product [Callosobruchus chinensis]